MLPGAPTTMLSPLTATDDPRLSVPAPSSARSFSASLSVPLQPPGGLTKTYAEPWPEGIPAAPEGAPATMMSPLTATLSKIAPSRVISLAFSVWGSSPLQPPAGLTNTYVTVDRGALGGFTNPTTAMMSALAATLIPKLSPSASEAISLAFSVRVPLQPPTGFTNTYAEPNPLAGGGSGGGGGGGGGASDAPTTMVSPLTARLMPKRSETAVPETVSLAFSVSGGSVGGRVQPPTGFTNTYAERWPALVSGTTTMVSPSTATRLPKALCGGASDAVSLALSVSGSGLVQPPAGFTNTYAASSPGAPTTMTSPLIATDWPKLSAVDVPPETVSFALSVSGSELLQPPAGLTNTYADPPLLLAPMTTVSPLTPTETPNPVTAAPAEAV